MAGNEKTPSVKERRASSLSTLLKNGTASEELRALTAKPGTPQAAQNAAAATAARELLGMPQPASPEISGLLQRPEQDSDFQRAMKSMLSGSRISPEDSLDPHEELASPTFAQLLKQKPVMSELDILLANPDSIKGSENLRVMMLASRDGNERIYLNQRATNDFLSAGGSANIKKMMSQSLLEAQRDIATRYLGKITEIEPGKLHPLLVKKMRDDPETAMYVNYAVNSANDVGLNGIMIANQLYQESGFRPDAVSPMGARGIGQIMPKYYQGRLGLNTIDDFHDPYKSMDANRDIMLEKTNKYKDQRLALIAYNGDDRAIRFVENMLGKPQITYADWHGFMENRRSTHPTNDKSAWQNETKHYVDMIAGKPTAAEKAESRTSLRTPALP